MPKRTFPLWSSFCGNLQLSNASHGSLSSRPWARKKLHEGAQEESKWCADTSPEHYPKLLTFLSCRHPEPLMVSSYWPVLDGLKLDKSTGEKSSAQSTTAYQFLMNKYLQVFVLYLLYDTLQFFCLLNISSDTCDAWPKWDAEALFN